MASQTSISSESARIWMLLQWARLGGEKHPYPSTDTNGNTSDGGIVEALNGSVLGLADQILATHRHSNLGLTNPAVIS